MAKCLARFIKVLAAIFLILGQILAPVDAEGKEYHIIELHIVAHIQEDGSVLISERRTFKFEGSFSFVYQDIVKAGFNEIVEIQAYKNGIPLIFSDKNERGNFTVSENRRNFQVRWVSWGCSRI